MKTCKQNAVASVVWPWQNVNVPKSRTGSHIRKAIKQSLISSVIGIVFLLLHRYVMGSIVLTMAGILLICGLFIPRLFARIEAAGRKTGHGMALGLTWILLAPFFFLCFVPGRFFLKLRGKDPLTRKLDSSANSYWIKYPPVQHPDQYRKQH